MMLAKLSGIPTTTQISRVSTPASSSGTIVNSTSPTRRSVIQSRSEIEMSAVKPACMKAVVTVWPASRIAIGPPVAVGSTASTARANWRSDLVVVGIALRIDLDPDPAAGLDPILGEHRVECLPR